MSPEERRSPAGAILALAALFLISPSPLIFLVPLAALLAVSGPGTVREMVWLAAAVGMSLLWLTWSHGIADQVANAMAVLMTGSFIVLSTREQPAFTRASWAVLLAMLAVTGWCAVWGIRWHDIELALTRQWWEISRQLVDSGRLNGGLPTSNTFLDRLADAGRPIAQLFPARLVISGILGLVLASSWHDRIAGRTLGRPAGSFGSFRFADHLVWLLIVAIAVLVIPDIHALQEIADGSAPVDMFLFTLQYWGPVASNLLVICAVLYAVRGAAVASRFVRPRAALVLLSLATIFLLPFTLIGLGTIGLADTWVNFRKWANAGVQ
ncbi:MAG: DUF2232 domain-containing protein [Gemmatimonadota bacterium]